jgi:hypothetical protein
MQLNLALHRTASQASQATGQDCEFSQSCPVARLAHPMTTVNASHEHYYLGSYINKHTALQQNIIFTPLRSQATSSFQKHRTRCTEHRMAEMSHVTINCYAAAESLSVNLVQ